jgi:hypothetical protein
MFGPRYREWKRTGIPPELPKAGVWVIAGVVVVLLLEWWLFR